MSTEEQTSQMVAPPTKESGGKRARWTGQERDLLEKRSKLAWAAQGAYFERSSILTVLNYLIGVPVVIVTVLAGSEIVVSHTTDKLVPLWVGIITVSAAVLASLQTFFRLGERAAFSSVAGQRYSVVRRRIEDLLASPPEDRQEVLEALKDLRKLTDDAGDHSPPIGERRWLTWAGYSEAEGPPPHRPWWRALFGIEDRQVRRRRKAK